MIGSQILYIIFFIAIGLIFFVKTKKDKKEKNNYNNKRNIEDDKYMELKKELNDKFKVIELDLFIHSKEINNLKRKNNILLNSYKILYFRKISNVILDLILRKYNLCLYKTEKIFIDESKPKYKQIYFPIIIAKEKIKNIEMNTINLLIDFLMFVKDLTSSVIHLVEKFEIQIEILFEIFDKDKIKIEQNDYFISSSLLINTLFGKGNKSIEKNEINNHINNLNSIKTEKNITNKTIDNILSKFENNKEKSDENNSSENGLSTIDERNSNDKNAIGNSNNTKELKNEHAQKEEKKVEITDKNELINKINNIIDNLQNYKINKKNNHINEIIEEIYGLKWSIENILKTEKDLTENELMKLNFIRQLNDTNLNDIFTIKEFNEINGELLFKKWKETFNSTLKSTEEFKSLIIYEENLKIEDLELATRALIDEYEINIFSEDPGDFKNYKLEILQKEKFKNYNLKQKEILVGK